MLAPCKPSYSSFRHCLLPAYEIPECCVATQASIMANITYVVVIYLPAVP